MPTIYEIKANLNEIEALIEEEALTEEDVKDTIESLEGSFYDKIDNILSWIKNLEYEAAGYKAEADRLNNLAKASEEKAKSLIQYVDMACQLMDQRKFSTTHFKINYRKGSEVVEVNEDLLPVDYFVEQDPKPISKTELKKLVKEGKEIPGVKLIRKPDSIQIQ